MSYVKAGFALLTKRERLASIGACIVFGVAFLGRIALTIEHNSEFIPVAGGAYQEGVVGQPVLVNPVISSNQVDQDLSALLFSPLGNLLSSLETSSDGRAYTLKLKENLLWSNSQPFSSDDIAFTIKAIQDPEARSPLAKNWQGVAVERVSALQIKLALPTPFVFFRDNIQNLFIIPRHIFGAVPPANMKLSAYNLEPVSNGPYRFEKLKKRKDGFITEYRLSANEYYKGTRPYIRTLSFVFFETTNDLLDAFRKRNIDGFGSLTPLDANPVLHAVTERIPMPRYYAVFFNTVNNALLKEEKVRQALELATDAKAIARDIFHDQAVPLRGPVFLDLLPKPGAFQSAATATLPYNPEAAREKLAGAGTQDVVLNLTVPNVPFLRPVAAAIANSWKAIGVKEVNIISLNPDTLVNDVIKTRNYEALLFGNVFENPADLFPFWHSSQRFFPGLNLSLYQNLKVDELIEETRQEQIPEKQRKNLEKIQTLITADTPAVFLFSLPYFYVHTERLRGFRQVNFTTPADRFANITEWYMRTARIIK